MSDEPSTNEAPLDALDAAIGEPVTVRLKDGTTYHGRLASFDQHMNLVLEAPEEELGPGIDTVDNTTVIRGDNVVSIES